MLTKFRIVSYNTRNIFIKEVCDKFPNTFLGHFSLSSLHSEIYISKSTEILIARQTRQRHYAFYLPLFHPPFVRTKFPSKLSNRTACKSLFAERIVPLSSIFSRHHRSEETFHVPRTAGCNNDKTVPTILWPQTANVDGQPTPRWRG